MKGLGGAEGLEAKLARIEAKLARSRPVCEQLVARIILAIVRLFVPTKWHVGHGFLPCVANTTEMKLQMVPMVRY